MSTTEVEVVDPFDLIARAAVMIADAAELLGQIKPPPE